MTTTRRSYTAEFKEEAVRLAGKRGLAAAARDLGLDRSLIGKWKRAMEGGEARSFPGKGNQHDDELAELRRSLRRAEEENAILKKAVGIFTTRPR